MSTDLERPWLNDELPEPTKKTSLVDDLALLYATKWKANENNFRKAATSTTDEESVHGTVAMDRAFIAFELWNAAAPGTKVAEANAAAVKRVEYWVAHRYGYDRTAIAEKIRLQELEAAQHPVSNGQDVVDTPASVTEDPAQS